MGDRTEHPSPRHLTFHVLGYFAVVGDEEPRPLRPMSARVVRRLLVARGTCVSEEQLIECFWAALDPQAARNNLHVTVHHARRALGARRLVRGDGAYRLVLAPEDRVDAEDFDRAASAALATTGPRRTTVLRDALAGWTGEPLAEDRYADWALTYRESLLNQRRTVSLALSTGLRKSGRAGEAVPVLRTLCADAPRDEEASRELMLALAASGRRDEALRTFEDLRAALQETWATDVSAATRRIAMAIGAGSERPSTGVAAASAATG